MAQEGKLRNWGCGRSKCNTCREHLGRRFVVWPADSPFLGVVHALLAVSSLKVHGSLPPAPLPLFQVLYLAECERLVGQGAESEGGAGNVADIGKVRRGVEGRGRGARCWRAVRVGRGGEGGGLAVGDGQAGAGVEAFAEPTQRRRLQPPRLWGHQVNRSQELGAPCV